MVRYHCKCSNPECNHTWYTAQKTIIKKCPKCQSMAKMETGKIARIK